MSKLSSIYSEIIKVVVNKVTIGIIAVCTLGISQIWTNYQMSSNERRITFLETNFEQEVSVRMEITKFLSNCPSYTGLSWIEYNKVTNKILFKKVITKDETIGIYDATTTNDLYSSSSIDRKSLHYFASLEEQEVYFINEYDEIWAYSFFSKVRTYAWKFTNEKIKKYSRNDYLSAILKEHGEHGIMVMRLYNVVIKDKGRNLIYIVTLGLSGKSSSCFNQNQSLTKSQLLDLAEFIKHSSNIA